ncbi:hypothetical protein JCM19053_3578 [Vibrio sp. JCM 19053]|nr:hypothetical protein JCM19053_3578 [Vibrio sp. JCM 19053]
MKITPVVAHEDQDLAINQAIEQIEKKHIKTKVSFLTTKSRTEDATSRRNQKISLKIHINAKKEG